MQRKAIASFSDAFEGSAKANRDYAQKQRQKKIEWLCSHMGSDRIWCSRCRYDTCFKAIHFHHLNPKQKENSYDTLGRWLGSYPFGKFQQKILTTSFLFLCANCHAELHAGVWSYGK